MVGYYDREAPVYDETRGGVARARDAARAVHGLSSGPGLLVDVAGGTGSVTAELARLGHTVLVVDPSVGMLAVAATRLPGRVVAALGDRLPLRDASVDTAVTVWLLHLLPAELADVVVAEVARVLRDGGTWVTTADKNQSHGRRGAVADDRDRLTRLTGGMGLVPAGEDRFSGSSAWGSAGEGDPVFTVMAFRRTPRPSYDARPTR